jgi:hypothetical protein
MSYTIGRIESEPLIWINAYRSVFDCAHYEPALALPPIRGIELVGMTAPQRRFAAMPQYVRSRGYRGNVTSSTQSGAGSSNANLDGCADKEERS